MNGTEQQAAGTRYAQLSAELKDLLTIVEMMDRNFATFVGELRPSLEAFEKDTNQALENLDHYARTALDEHRAFVTQTFWQRLRWLVTGR